LHVPPVSYAYVDAASLTFQRWRSKFTDKTAGLEIFNL